VGRVKVMDESGVNLALTRSYGRAPTGERVVDAVPQNSGEHVALLATLGLPGSSAPRTVNGATDGEVFLASVQQVLCPTLVVGDIVSMDNRGAHQVGGVAQALAAQGARLLSLPPYSPELSPIEQGWSKIKTFLRQLKARTRETLEEAVRQALRTVTESEARPWFAHCGYALH
jgi:transposase